MTFMSSGYYELVYGQPAPALWACLSDDGRFGFGKTRLEAQVALVAQSPAIQRRMEVCDEAQ